MESGLEVVQAQAGQLPFTHPTTLVPGPERGWGARQLLEERQPGDQMAGGL